MTVLTWLRFVKLLAVAALVGGSMALALCRAPDDRRRVGLGLVAPGFGVTWTAGMLLAHQLSVSLLEGWILGAMGLSMVSLLVMLFSISKPGRDTLLANSLILLTLGAALFFMIWRPELGCHGRWTAYNADP